MPDDDPQPSDPQTLDLLDDPSTSALDLSTLRTQTTPRHTDVTPQSQDHSTSHQSPRPTPTPDPSIDHNLVLDHNIPTQPIITSYPPTPHVHYFLSPSTPITFPPTPHNSRQLLANHWPYYRHSVYYSATNVSCSPLSNKQSIQAVLFSTLD